MLVGTAKTFEFILQFSPSVHGQTKLFVCKDYKSTASKSALLRYCSRLFVKSGILVDTNPFPRIL